MTTPAFIGETYFDINFKAFGVSFKRIARATYHHTPEWPYYDTGKRREIQGEPALILSLDVLARRPSRRKIDEISAADQQWISIQSLLVPGLLKPGIYQHLKAQIDDIARAEDAKRRRRDGKTSFPRPETL